LSPIQNRFQPTFRRITHLQLSYLRILKFEDEFLRIVPCNRGTWNGLGRGAPRRDVMRVRASTRRRRAPPYYGQTSESVRERGVCQPRTHLQEPPRPESPRATRRLRALRSAVGAPAAHARQGRRTRASKHREGLASKRGASVCASAIKERPLLLPRVSTTARRSAIAAAASSHSCKLPLPVKGQPILALPYDPLELPCARVDLPRPKPRRKPSTRRRAAATSSSPLFGAISDHVATTNPLR
jgi:hypothetical protein